MDGTPEETAPILKRLEAPCYECVARCGLEAQDVDAVILVGGMTRMPAVQATPIPASNLRATDPRGAGGAARAPGRDPVVR